MSQWHNPVPPVPSLRERYPLSGVSFPSIPVTILWSAILAVAGVFVFAPIMDKIVLGLINAFAPSFVPPKGELTTQRQAIERLAYQTAAIAGNLFILWPVVLTSFISLVEGFAWVVGSKPPRWIPYIWWFAETFMGNSLFSYYKEVPKLLLQLDQLRDYDLVLSTEQFLRVEDGISRVIGYDRYEHVIAHDFRMQLLLRGLLTRKPTTTTTTTHLRDIGLESTTAFITFIADRSSNTTCISPELFWAQCGPIMRLGVPVGSPIVVFIITVVVEWWSARKGTKEGNEMGWAPRMCQRELQRKADRLSRLHHRDWSAVWMHEYQMQKGRLLWGCPWKPNLRQIEAWMRHN